MDTLFPALGAAVAVAGGDKLTGDRVYRRMFRHLGWSRGAMRIAGAAELAGGIMLAPHGTRRLGGAVLTAVSVALLAGELRHHDQRLAAARGAVLLAALAALLAPGRPRPARS